MSERIAHYRFSLRLLLDVLAESWRYLRTGEFVASVTDDRGFIFGDAVNPDNLGSGTLLGYIIIAKNHPETNSAPAVPIERLRAIQRPEHFVAVLTAISDQSKVTRITSNGGSNTLFYWVAPSMYQEMVGAA